MRADRPGRFSDGRTAESRPVMVRVLSTGLEIRGGDGLLVAVWRTEDLLPDGELADRPGVRLRCTAEPDARLVVEDAYFIVESLPEIAAAPAATRRRRASALAVALLLGLGIVLGLVAGLPQAARLAVELVPVETERAWGRGMAETLQDQIGLCRGVEGQAALDGLVKRLAAGLVPARRQVRARVLDGAAVNALALPGGEIVVFRGLITQAEGPDELAGVLAHELTHEAERHPTDALVRGLGVGALATLITGDASGVLAGAAALALSARYTRDDETAADRGGLALLAQAGIDSGGLAAFFRRVEAAEAAGGHVPAWLDSHPEAASRAAAAQAARPAHRLPPALRDEEWRAIKSMCGA